MSCESSSELYRQDKQTLTGQKQPLSCEQLIPEDKHSTVSNGNTLEDIMLRGNDADFQRNLMELSQAIKEGSNADLVTNSSLHLRLMNLYYKLYKTIDSKPENQEYILFLLSILAEIVKQHPHVRLPFAKKTALCLLSFDEQTLQVARGSHQIVLILMTLMENMARQGRLMVRLGVEKQLKQGLLLLISKVDEYSALRISLRALLELQAKTKIIITSQQLEKNGISTRIRDHFGDSAFTKIKSIVCRPNAKKIETVSNMTLFELISNK